MQFDNARLDFKSIARAALEQAPRILSSWLPDGKRQGGEYLSRNPTRSDDSAGSFSVNLNTGVWKDFATGDAGGDLIALIAYLEGTDQAPAARRLADFLGIANEPPQGRPRREDHRNGPPRHDAPADSAPGATLTPIPEDALAVRPQAHPRHGPPSASWIYRDPHGRPLLFFHRFDPQGGQRKQFAPQTWTPASGWAWKAPTAPRPLFNLDQLHARPEAPVLVTEGEKASDAATALFPEHVSVTAMNGAQSPALTDWTPLAGRTVCIWPDLDAAGKTFADHVARLAREVGAARVSVLDLPSLALDPLTGEQRPNPAGWDAADALQGGWTPDTLARSARWLSQDGDTDWPTPQIIGEHLEAQDYPLDALPAPLYAVVTEVQGFTQAPPALVASSCLAVLSLVIQGLVNVRRAPQLTGPVSCYFLTVADSGERKSETDSRFLAPVRQWEAEQLETYMPLVKQYRADLEALEAEKSGVKDRIRQEAKGGKPTNDFKRQLKALEQQTPDPPREPRRLFTDCTPEAFAYTLVKHCLSGGIFSSEAGQVLGGHGMNKDNALKNMALNNALWDGPSFRVDRKTSDSFLVKGVRATIALMIQAPALLDFIDRAGTIARGSGWFARFLLAAPASTQGTRLYREPPANWPAHSAYCRRVLELLALPLPLGEDGTLDPPALDLDPEAKQAWIAFHDAIEQELGDGGELRQVRDIASKVADSAARLSALFHVYQHGPHGTIGPDAFASAARIVAWHLSESRRFFAELALPQELSDAARLDAWLANYANRERSLMVPKHQARQYGPIRDGERLDRAIKELDAADRLRVRKEGRRILLVLNPRLPEIRS